MLLLLPLFLYPTFASLRVLRKHPFPEGEAKRWFRFWITLGVLLSIRTVIPWAPIRRITEIILLVYLVVLKIKGSPRLRYLHRFCRPNTPAAQAPPRSNFRGFPPRYPYSNARPAEMDVDFNAFALNLKQKLARLTGITKQGITIVWLWTLVVARTAWRLLQIYVPRLTTQARALLAEVSAEVERQAQLRQTTVARPTSSTPSTTTESSSPINEEAVDPDNREEAERVAETTKPEAPQVEVEVKDDVGMTKEKMDEFTWVEETVIETAEAGTSSSKTKEWSSSRNMEDDQVRRRRRQLEEELASLPRVE